MVVVHEAVLGLPDYSARRDESSTKFSIKINNTNDALLNIKSYINNIECQLISINICIDG